MGVSSSQLQPQELITFKKLNADVPLANIEIPEKPENRKQTNVKWFKIFVYCVVLLLPFLIYNLRYSDPEREYMGYDKCGNVCGRENYQWDNIPCSGKDFTDYPYLQYEDDSVGGDDAHQVWMVDRRCVQSCQSGYLLFMGKCFKVQNELGLIMNAYSDTHEGKEVILKEEKTERTDIGTYLRRVKWQIIISCLLSMLVAIGMLFLFRHSGACLVWSILIGCFLALLVAVIDSWYDYWVSSDSSSESSGGLAGLFILTIIVVILGLVLYWNRRKIRLVIMLLQEAAKVIFDMPGLVIIPPICFISILILTILFAFTTFYLACAGKLEHYREDFYVYVVNPAILFTMAYNVLVYFWIYQFFTGIQYMVIAGAVSKWYFTREKVFLGRPIMASVSNTFRFHLGSVALGALLITIVKMIKIIIWSLIKIKKLRELIRSLIDGIEILFKFLSTNAYIITAMHGEEFMKSGRRAARMIIQNIKDIIAVSFFGDFVLGMTKFLIVIITLLLSVGIFTISPSPSENMDFIAFCIIAIFSAVVAWITFGVFETIVDTIFICYCEDNLLNDGMARPYFMSRDLMEFVQSSKEVCQKK